MLFALPFVFLDMEFLYPVLYVSCFSERFLNIFFFSFQLFPFLVLTFTFSSLFFLFMLGSANWRELHLTASSVLFARRGSVCSAYLHIQ